MMETAERCDLKEHFKAPIVIITAKWIKAPLNKKRRQQVETYGKNFVQLLLYNAVKLT